MDRLSPLIANLNAEGRPRIWSLVITVFGDMVQPRGGRISTARLGRLLGRVGIEGGALRTALSRLSADGWVTSRREGRTSSYTLTARGQKEFGPATLRIYAPPRPGPVPVWTFTPREVPGGLPLAGGSLLPGDVAAKGVRLTGALQPGPEVWEGLPPDHRLAVERLAADLRSLSEVPDTPLDAAAARLLLVHRWRRLVLRWPEVPMELMPATMDPQDLHGAVAVTYARLSPLTENWLDRAEADMAAMPKADASVAIRFTPLQST